MTDDTERHDLEAQTGSETEMTGNPAVDEVLRSLGDLDGRPVEEHVAVFESAHEHLRAVLAGAGEADEGAGPGQV